MKNSIKRTNLNSKQFLLTAIFKEGFKFAAKILN
jgi:hypothetical protein